jgi:hypothetical protein
MSRALGVFSMATLALSWIGCTTGGPEKVDAKGEFPELGVRQPIAPPPATEPTTGLLRVFGPTIRDNAAFPNDYPRISHVSSGYTVYNKEGASVRYVQNFWTNINAGPLTTELDPGKYLVLMDEPNQIPKFFWVTVEKGKMTTVSEKTAPTPEPAPNAPFPFPPSSEPAPSAEPARS